MRIAVLALDGAFDTALASVLDVFTTANEVAETHQGAATPCFEIELIGMRRDVRTALGMRVPVNPSTGASGFEWLVSCPSCQAASGLELRPNASTQSPTFASARRRAPL